MSNRPNRRVQLNVPSSSSASSDFLTKPQSSEASSSPDFLTNPQSTATPSSSPAPSPSPSPPPPNRRPRKQPQPQQRQRNDRFLQEMRKLQNSTDFCIPRLPFQRLVREILQKFQPDFRMQSQSLEALQTCGEFYIHNLFEDAYLISKNGKRTTLMLQDLQLMEMFLDPEHPH